MVARYPIETWSRPQLEDHYHTLVDELHNAQKKVKDHEKEIKAFHSRFRKNLLDRKTRIDKTVEREKFDEVLKEKQILEMKLKAAKHQLLLYTNPMARAATASAMTGRSTFRQTPSMSTWRNPKVLSGVSIDRAPMTPMTSSMKKDNIQLSTTEEKFQIVKLNRLLKIKDEQIRQLQKAANKKSSSIESTSEESSESSRSEESMEKSPSSNNDSPKIAAKPSSSHQKKLAEKLKVAENEYQILLSEVEVLRSANERLVQQSLSKTNIEWGVKENLEDKKKILELEENLRLMEMKLKDAKRRPAVQQKVSVIQEMPKVEENIKPPVEDSREPRRKTDESRILEKLYNEVVDVLKTHDLPHQDTQNSSQNWQKLYAELYEELEKVKNLLIIQYDIDQKHNVEIRLLKEELERKTRSNSESLEKAKNVLEEKQKRIFMLEEQIRVIAYSTQKPVTIQNSTLKITRETSTDLSLRLIYVKPSAAVTSKFFFSLEFFDFQLETTPVLLAKEQKLDFTTVYELIVSNLLIHYLHTNGISIEMYKPSKDQYRLIATGTISLIPIVEDLEARKFCSEIVLKSVDNGEEICTLRYEIETSNSFDESFGRFKKAEMAKSLLPLEISNNSHFEELIVMVNRVEGFTPMNAEFCVIYELLAFSPFFTDFGNKSEILSRKNWMIPKSEASRDMFVQGTITFFLVENVSKQDGVVALLHIPLLPLCKPGGIIRGSFEMSPVNSETPEILIDLCVMWKNSKPAFIVEQEKDEQKVAEVNEIKQEEPEIVPVKRTSKQFEVSPVLESELQQIARPTSIIETNRVQTPSQSSSSSDDSRDVFSPPPPDIEDDEEGAAAEDFSYNVLPRPKPRVFESPEKDLGLEPENDRKDENQEELEKEDEVEEEIVEEDLQEEEEVVSAKSSSREEPEVNMLGELPPITKPRTSLTNANVVISSGRGVEFSEPLHHSIPPSETSSNNSPRHTRPEKPKVALPDYHGHGIIRTASIGQQIDNNIVDESLKVMVRLEKFEIVPYSRLLAKMFDDSLCVIDFQFLDFPAEENRTDDFSLPRASGVSVELDAVEEFPLTKRQVALLDQWIELGNKLDFSLYSVGHQEAEIAVASITLFRNNSQNLSIAADFIDIDGEHLAEIQLSIQYSAELLQQLK